jgi:very-short-patch-repair endonuclease
LSAPGWGDMSDKLKRFRLATARRLRSNATLAESRLWKELRQLPTYGTHFRRQVPLGSYVVDFACLRAKLVIEVDGSQHGQEGEMRRDAARTQWLESVGYRVLRFWNSEVSGNLSGVLERIYADLYGSTHAEPSHFGHPTPARTQQSKQHQRVRDARRPSPSRGG